MNFTIIISLCFSLMPFSFFNPFLGAMASILRLVCFVPSVFSYCYYIGLWISMAGKLKVSVEVSS